jgi:hypothetical protein
MSRFPHVHEIQNPMPVLDSRTPCREATAPGDWKSTGSSFYLRESGDSDTFSADRQNCTAFKVRCVIAK